MNTPFNHPKRLFAAAKWAFSTRRVRRADALSLCDAYERARPGDLVLGRVQSIGSHRRIQLPTGRPSELYPADLVVLACGARYASDQFEGLARICPDGAAMLAGGGCIGEMVASNSAMKSPTMIQPLGLIAGENNRILNLADYALPAKPVSDPTIPVIGVIGAAMNAGKTTATAALIHGLRGAGWRVAGLKGTGTGAFGDFNAYVDAGAHYVADFTDAGLVSTYRTPLPRIKSAIAQLLAQAETAHCTIAVVELADGIFQGETAALLADRAWRQGIDGWVFACGDPLAASGGAVALKAVGLSPLAITGKVSCSPMATEEAKAATGLPVMTRADLLDPSGANALAIRATHPPLDLARAG